MRVCCLFSAYHSEARAFSAERREFTKRPNKYIQDTGKEYRKFWYAAHTSFFSLPYVDSYSMIRQCIQRKITLFFYFTIESTRSFRLRITNAFFRFAVSPIFIPCKNVFFPFYLYLIEKCFINYCFLKKFFARTTSMIPIVKLQDVQIFKLV